jgi:ergothioneine biosynthesis protein EgtB
MSTFLETSVTDIGGHAAEPISELCARLFETRAQSMKSTSPLSAEDMAVQAMDDASPTKWHLAHTSWFFETFLLRVYLDGYEAFDPAFNYCFNSYYESLGERQPRPKRGLLTRPSIERVLAYRRYVDAALQTLLSLGFPRNAEEARLLETGINHEQQHQELMLTDILALFAANPLRPAYRAPPARSAKCNLHEAHWLSFDGGLRLIGDTGRGFAWDNETPRHTVFLQPYRLADRLVSNAEWLEFISDGGYRTPTLWQSDGWVTINREAWRAPLYWEQRDGAWLAMSLEGLQPVDPAAPVMHVSYYEADAFARWAGARLPTEFEWESAASSSEHCGGEHCRRPAQEGLRQLYGAVWQWTASAHLPYPGYRPPDGALGEYNGKFMIGQHVLRGGSFATPPRHTRPTYRNFFYPHQRWQFLGLRLASEAD